jgi:hypothetical protein
MRMTFTCAVAPELATQRDVASANLTQFIQSCGFECVAEVTEAFVTYDISLGEP